MDCGKSVDYVGLSRLVGRILSRVGAVNIHYSTRHYYVTSDDDSIHQGGYKTTLTAHYVHAFVDRYHLQVDQLSLMVGRYRLRCQICVVGCHFDCRLFLLDRS